MKRVRAGCSPCAGRFGPSRRTLCARTGADLNQLLRTFRRFDAVSLAASSLSQEERESWERRLAAAYTDCGCSVGGATVLVVLCLLVAVAAADPHAWTWKRALAGAALCFFAALGGKLLGIGLARANLWRYVKRIQLILH